MSRKWFFLGSIIISLLLSSCYKQENTTYIDEYDITLTYYDTDFSFSTYSSFMVRDSVLLYSDYLKVEEIEKFYTDGISDNLRNQLIQKFKSLGYTESNDIETADFVINPTITMMQKSGMVYNWWWSYPGYWGWYGGWYYKNSDYYYYPPYWGWYPNVSYYSYKTGSMIMEMADGQSVRDYRAWLEANQPNGDVNPEDVPEILFRWTSQIDGVLGDSGDYNTERALRGFNEAFEQSPYLKK